MLLALQGLKARHKSQAKIYLTHTCPLTAFRVIMSPIITDPEFVSELLTLSTNTNTTFWIPAHPALPEWILYQILPQNIQVPSKHTTSQLPEDRKELHAMRSVYAQAKLAVEGANLDADIENRRL